MTSRIRTGLRTARVVVEVLVVSRSPAQARQCYLERSLRHSLGAQLTIAPLYSR